MKYIFTAILFLLYLPVSFSQNADFENKYDLLLQKLGAEDWNTAEKTCKELLSYAERTDSLESGRQMLRYIYIYSVAGLMNNKKLTKEAALKKVKNLEGKKIKLPGHPFHSKCPSNCTQIGSEDKNTFLSIVNNNNATQIFSFEYVKIKDGIKEPAEELEGKVISLSGTLKEISVEGNMFPRFRLNVTDGSYLVQQ